MQRPTNIWIKLTVLAAAILLPAIFLRPLFTPDEVRYAQIPQEIVTTGNWAVPQFVDLKYFEKPVLGYWLTAASIIVFGEHEFAVRLPSFLSVLGTALVLAWLVFRVRRGVVDAAPLED